MKKIGQLLLYLFVSFLGNAQEETWIHPNKGQWDSSISSKVELNQGELLVGKKGFAYFLHDAKSKHQHTIHEENHLEDSLFKTQTILKQFINANWANEINYETIG